jgi:multidrug efflux pump subunit AcrA (membrane-fusion protein)
VLIFFDNQDERIKNGMSVSIDYITKEVKDVIIVPVKAVVPYNTTPHVKMKNNEYVQVLP